MSLTATWGATWAMLLVIKELLRWMGGIVGHA
jgi:hypothetical protein